MPTIASPSIATAPITIHELTQDHCKAVLPETHDGLPTYCGGARVSTWGGKRKGFILSPYCAHHQRRYSASYVDSDGVDASL